MKRVVISGIGTALPETSIGNDELVESFNLWLAQENERRESLEQEPLAGSDSDFIVYASGVKRRRVLFPDGVLDPQRMAPTVPHRGDNEVSVMAEFGLQSARVAIADAGISPETIDLTICSASHLQRPYPAIAIEIQKELGTSGGAFDMGLGCSSAAAAIHVASNLVRSGAQKRILISTPEIVTGHLNFRDRQTHFIFGDGSIALIVEALEDGEQREGRFEILDSRTWTQFSNSIRSNFGFLSRLSQDDPAVVKMEGIMINQVGNRVFKEVTLAGHRFIQDFLYENGLTTEDIRRFWLHQANARMNAMILKLTLGFEADHDRAPVILEDIGNTAAAGAIIALERNHRDMRAGDYGLICAFGAGYSIGGALLRMM